VSDVKNSFTFSWIKKSKKSERQEPLDQKEKSNEDFSSSPTSVPNVVKSCVSGDEPESADSNCVQFVNEQAKNEFIAIQMEDDDESETDESGDQNQNTKWALNLKSENEVDYNTRPGPSLINKTHNSDIVQQPELKLTNEEKADDVDESDDSLKSARNGRFERLKKNPVLNWIKRYKVSKSRTRNDTPNQSNGLVNERSGDFSECPSKESGVANAQHAAVLNISTSSRIHRLVRRLKRKSKVDSQHDTAHAQPHDITPEHTVPSPCDANEDNNNAPGPATSQPADQTDVIIQIDSDEESDDNCCMQSCHRCVCGAKEKACVMCSFMERQKRKWDEWNPDLNNPFFMCLAESKLAGLKEAVKPNRGICFR